MRETTLHQLQGDQRVGGAGQAEEAVPHGGSLEQMHAGLQGAQVFPSSSLSDLRPITTTPRYLFK